MVIEKIRTCTDCKKDLPIDDFPPVGDKYNSIRRQCRLCHGLRCSKNPKALIERRKWVAELHDLQKKNKRRCSICKEIKHLDTFPNDKSKKVFYKKKSYCKECAHNKWRIPYRKTENHKKLKAAQDKKYYKNNKEKIYKHIKERYHSDPQYKLSVNLRSRLGQFIRKNNTKKSISALELLGADVDFVKKYLQNKFLKGMTWDNWSRDGWHIDHIIPLSSFDLTKIEEQRKAFHYTNLQPLWAVDNLKKGDKIE